ncbi:Positive regulator of purine utilization [Tolypocladium paradoxum]|uniref:Positive regulator of purine utilization n=1 Tax=Tolypocladium paradoxum TaxID=94208 RepID=A0A2S4KRH8_9HYPO|nr:Positive regulator of purine utilization [Tolypocladium paradoxum]
MKKELVPRDSRSALRHSSAPHKPPRRTSPVASQPHKSQPSSLTTISHRKPPVQMNNGRIQMAGSENGSQTPTQTPAGGAGRRPADSSRACDWPAPMPAAEDPYKSAVAWFPSRSGNAGASCTDGRRNPQERTDVRIPPAPHLSGALPCSAHGPAATQPGHSQAFGEALDKCHSTIRIFDMLYRRNLLVHSWISFHALVLATLTMLYCIKTVSRLSRGRMQPESTVRSESCRDILDDLGRSMIRGQAASCFRTSSSSWPQLNNECQTSAAARDPNRSFAAFPDQGALSLVPSNGQPIDQDASEVPLNLLDDFLASGSIANYFDSSESNSMDSIVRNLVDVFDTTNPDMCS